MAISVEETEARAGYKTCPGQEGVKGKDQSSDVGFAADCDTHRAFLREQREQRGNSEGTERRRWGGRPRCPGHGTVATGEPHVQGRPGGSWASPPTGRTISWSSRPGQVCRAASSRASTHIHTAAPPHNQPHTRAQAHTQHTLTPYQSTHHTIHACHTPHSHTRAFAAYIRCTPHHSHAHSHTHTLTPYHPCTHTHTPSHTHHTLTCLQNQSGQPGFCLCLPFFSRRGCGHWAGVL